MSPLEHAHNAELAAIANQPLLTHAQRQAATRAAFARFKKARAACPNTKAAPARAFCTGTPVRISQLGGLFGDTHPRQ
jgi:hypothetical protein